MFLNMIWINCIRLHWRNSCFFPPTLSHFHNVGMERLWTAATLVPLAKKSSEWSWHINEVQYIFRHMCLLGVVLYFLSWCNESSIHSQSYFQLHNLFSFKKRVYRFFLLPSNYSWLITKSFPSLLSWSPATLHGTYWGCKWRILISYMVDSYKSVK